MTNFQKGTRRKLRYTTPSGLISIERLWDFSGSKLPYLAQIIEHVDDQIIKDVPDSLAFLKSNTSKPDSDAQLMFDIAKEIYLILQSEIEDAKEAKNKKVHNEKILAIMKENEEAGLKKLSNAELEKLLQ